MSAILGLVGTVFQAVVVGAALLAVGAAATNGNATRASLETQLNNEGNMYNSWIAKVAGRRIVVKNCVLFSLAEVESPLEEQRRALYVGIFGSWLPMP